ncbi:thiamine-phosphate kinase [Lysobacter soyae]|uniref:Thiamine-monophosphate kinase n=1 Tax=Lysobacter soyae TaxID=2764185 RepID=A0ABX8WQ34_9GAMM|nr:thiamine-phosphate kinase [Lysobacter sp. CJ11]QYR52688.1 thiamine-phosphate kinase [Lysobacter sp. CJ11]
MKSAGEFDLIEFIRTQQSVVRPDVLLGIGDDAAMLQAPADHALVMCSDTLNEGVHFPVGTDPEAIGWKSLAVNLSDLAAMGACPSWCLLNLCLPESDTRWLERFTNGFFELAAAHDVVLVGGDTTRGPLSISVTACGFVPRELALTRSGAKVGDDIWVSGTLGDAALALRRMLAGESVPAELMDALDRPTPRVALGSALRGFASSCIDVSDGVLQDLGHVCAASGLAAEVAGDWLPVSDAFDALAPREARLQLQSSGDDYELCFSAAPGYRNLLVDLAEKLDLRLTRIGSFTSGQGVHLTQAGRLSALEKRGHAHF